MATEEELLKRWKEILDEMAGTEYDCSFDCGSRREGYCYHSRLFREEEEKGAKILEELLRAEGGREAILQAAEAECRRPERQGWGEKRGLGIIQKFRAPP